MDINFWICLIIWSSGVAGGLVQVWSVVAGGSDIVGVVVAGGLGMVGTGFPCKFRQKNLKNKYLAQE